MTLKIPLNSKSWCFVCLSLTLGSFFIGVCQGFVIPSVSSNRRRSASTTETVTWAHSDHRQDNQPGVERRDLFQNIVSGLVASVVVLQPQSANARWMLDEDTGDYVEVEDVDWQTAWKQRLDKASNMSQEEIFNAARGAGNRELAQQQEESPAARKRRALSACRSAASRADANVASEKECTLRVLDGDTDFILNSN